MDIYEWDYFKEKGFSIEYGVGYQVWKKTLDSGAEIIISGEENDIPTQDSDIGITVYAEEGMPVSVITLSRSVHTMMALNILHTLDQWLAAAESLTY